ncbi:hypothetical protein AB0I60_22535 [Actinosynnema sp. NPDC050436]|uniref:pentapeptide repeat-containing protein n=1 Tax=Actinosynnema sp. NPDC050436 TaxID=3155659 RepID=UPI0033FF192E
MPTWVMWLAVALVVAAVVVRHHRRSQADTLLDEHARRRTGSGPTPVSVWREANRRFRAGEREGLLLLAEIGRSVPRRRQDVVDTWLAALRGGVSRGLDSPWRTAVQRELVAHLRPGDDYWPGMAVHASGAILVDFDLSGCRVGEVDFTGAVFVGDARFAAMTVTGEARFDGARFLRHAVFTDALFARSASFALAVFTGNLAFAGVQVAGAARLRAAKISGRADLRRAEFGGSADFAEVFYGGRALFGDVVFHQDAVFSRSWFRGWTDVGSALIGEAAEFGGVRFGHRVMH